MPAAQQRLAKLVQLWNRERACSRERFERARAGVALKERVKNGVALTDLMVDEEDVAPGGRTLLWLASRSDAGAVARLTVRVGEPVRLWWDDPEEADACRGTVARKSGVRLAVMVDGDAPERLDDGGFRLDVDDSDATFERGRRALAAFADAERKHREATLREVLLGDREPTFDAGHAEVPRRGSHSGTERAFATLNEVQQDAVKHALAADDVALIHGPPGTGKTTTLAVVIGWAAARGETVLATAASNMAVDNLVAALIGLSVRVVRVGHPARVSEGIAEHTLSEQLERSDEMKLALGWIRDAHSLRRRIAARRSRGRADWAALRSMRAEMRQLFTDARRQVRRAEQRLLSEADVVCATAAGADSRILGSRRFDRVVIDEATQAVDPIALVALARAQAVVLAGDPQQLPPTVLDQQAARDGLSETLFDRLLAAHGQAVCRMLTVQYRMSSELMEFPSQAMYQGRLEAAPSVASRRLTDLPDVMADPLRPGPLLFIDTAGKGWDETRQGDAVEQGSVFNAGQATRVIAEVRRCLRRGVRPSDVAVITPYAAQRALLSDGLSAELADGLEVGTVDSFQGREKEAVFVDLVRSNAQGELGFVADTRRMNVAFTRARRWLCVIADSATFGGNAFFSAFMETVESQGGWISAWSDDGDGEL